MAFRRKARRPAARRSTRYSSARRPARSTRARSGVRRNSRASSRTNTIRLVIEQPAANPIQRPEGSVGALQVVSAKRRSAF